MIMDLVARTLESLDWPVLLDRLAWHARTLAGARAAESLVLADSAAGCRRLFEEVEEVRGLEVGNDHVPVGPVGDVGGLVERCAAGAVLEGPSLQDIGSTLRALVDLRRWLWDRREAAPLLWSLAEPIVVEGEVLDLLERSFDATGAISGETWPEVGERRRRVGAIKSRIKNVLEDILRSGDFADILQERFVTERGGRFVIPVKAGYRRGLGIVHDRSSSGETAYVEPAAVVEAQNELGEVEAELLAEERRILGLLSRMVGRCAAGIAVSLAAALRLDLGVARSHLGDELRGTIPTVGEEGVLILDGGRHPVLALRGIDVVPNDLRLDSRQPALVLTGPNTGGKTVALKLLGLAAWMVRAGIPVPARAGSRVDCFRTILADIGDHQTVSGDLSTFSGHVQVCREVLAQAGADTLVLLDEIAVGTDPAQGAALARAVMEAVLARGARLVVTTHYAELKVLPLQDARFAAAAVQYQDGRPTYRVQVGLPGSSHAIAIARHLGLSGDVLERAQSLLDAASRTLDEALSGLESQQSALLSREDALRVRLQEADRREKALNEREHRIEDRARRLEQTELARFKDRLRDQEEEIKSLIASIQARGQSDGMREANAALETVRATRRQISLGDEPPPPPPPQDLKVGDRVQLRQMPSPGQVVSLSAGKAEVRVGSVVLWVPLADVTALTKGEQRQIDRRQRADGRAESAPDDRAGRREQRAGKKADRRAQESLAEQGRASTGAAPRVRTSTNTLDLRGQRVEDALVAVEFFLDRMLSDRQPVAFLLHGHGTGALKQALRQFLPRCAPARSFRAADPDEGGDAFTFVEL